MTTDTFTYACQHCGGTIAVEGGQDQPHDCGNLTIELTNALIRHENTILVRLERDWTLPDGERWTLTVDRARAASGLVPPRMIDGWVEATTAAAQLAKDVYAHEMANRESAGRLTSAWGSFARQADVSDG